MRRCRLWVGGQAGFADLSREWMRFVAQTRSVLAGVTIEEFS
jgi:hypothetical protein